MRLKGLLLFCYIADGISDLITNKSLRRRTLSPSDQRIKGSKLSTKEFQGLDLSTNSGRDHLSTVEDYPIISSDGDRFKISSRFLGAESESKSGSSSNSVSGSESWLESGPGSGSKSGFESGLDGKVIGYQNDNNVYNGEEYRKPPSKSSVSSGSGDVRNIFSRDRDESESSDGGLGGVVLGVAGVAAVGTGVVAGAVFLGAVGAAATTTVGLVTLTAAGEPDPDLVGTLPLNVALNVRDTVPAPTQAPESTNMQSFPAQHPMTQSTYDAGQDLLQASDLSIGDYLALALPWQIVAVPASSFTLNYNILNGMTEQPSTTDIAEAEFITGLFITERLKRYYGAKPNFEFYDLTLIAARMNGDDNSISITYHLKTIFSHESRLPTKEDVGDIVERLFTGVNGRRGYLGLLKGKLVITNPISLVNAITLETSM